MQFVWWAAVIGAALLFAIDACLDGMSDDRKYEAMHSRMKFAMCFIVIGVAAKVAKFIA